MYMCGICFVCCVYACVLCVCGVYVVWGACVWCWGWEVTGRSDFEEQDQAKELELYLVGTGGATEELRRSLLWAGVCCEDAVGPEGKGTGGGVARAKGTSSEAMFTFRYNL